MSRTVKAVVIKQKTERAIHKSQSFLILYVSLYDFVRNIFEIFFNFPVTCTILFTAMPDRQVWGGEVILNISEKLKDLANFEKRDWKIVLENNEPGIKGCCFSQHPFGCLALA